MALTMKSVIIYNMLCCQNIMNSTSMLCPRNGLSKRMLILDLWIWLQFDLSTNSSCCEDLLICYGNNCVNDHMLFCLCIWRFTIA